MEPTPDTEPKKRSPVRAFLLLTCCAIIGLIVWYVATGGLNDPTENTVDAGRLDAKAVGVLDSNVSDLRFELTGENTDIKWTGSNVIGQSPTGYFHDLSGSSVIDSKTNQLKHFEVTIDMNGVQAMASSLTKKLKHNGFFEVDKFPTAEFVSTLIIHQPDANSPASTTSIIEGNFKLRDVTRSIRIPVEVAYDESTFTLKSKFKVNRKDYGVVYSDSMGDALIRDSVLIEISIDCTSNIDNDPSANVVEVPEKHRPILLHRNSSRARTNRIQVE